MLPDLSSKIAYVRALPWKQALIGLGAVAGGIFLYNRFYPDKPISSTPQVAQQAPQVENVPQAVIAGPKKLVVYKRDKIVQKVDLPPVVRDNPQNQFTAAVQVPVSPYGGTATSFTNMSTGKSDIVISSKPRPLFGVGGKTSIGLFGGMSTKGNVALGYADQQILRVGPVNLGVAAGGGVVGVDGLLGAVVRISGEF
ncbi:MAG: hypothetical protein HGB26_06205 [Desulfobulbaceae bacterium]|nr:hypothetical protein [Desulfobulbaceae bacterium]